VKADSGVDWAVLAAAATAKAEAAAAATAVAAATVEVAAATVAAAMATVVVAEDLVVAIGRRRRAATEVSTLRARGPERFVLL
jgi:hypothetical protein